MAGQPPFLAGRPHFSPHIQKAGRPAPKSGRPCSHVCPWPCFPPGRKFQAFPCNGYVKGLNFPLFRMHSVAQIVRSTLCFVKFCLSSCCFAYRVVVLLIELFVELSCFVFLSCYSLFKQFCRVLFIELSALLCFAYRVVNLLRFC